jgi:L-malate glycosyltransferase
MNVVNIFTIMAYSKWPHFGSWLRTAEMIGSRIFNMQKKPASLEHAQTSIAFVWENFGPIHSERCRAVAELFVGRRRIVGIELIRKSGVYDWVSEQDGKFHKITLFDYASLDAIPIIAWVYAIVRVCIQQRATDIFFCHYEYCGTFLAACILRCLGQRVYIMNDSKYDDYTRYLPREVLKTILYVPYKGVVTASLRASDYHRFLGVSPSRIKLGYNCRSIVRIRTLAASPPAPGGVPFKERHFSFVGRMVPKKNHVTAIAAYKLYCQSVENPRRLYFYGSGELEDVLLKRVKEEGLEEKIVFCGFLQNEEICKALGRTLALLLPSSEEQFGNVVIEAQAMGVPVILSENCGARDLLIRSGVNGFVVEPDNPAGFSYFMTALSEDEGLWTKMCKAADSFVWRADVSQFAQCVSELMPAI